MKRRAARTPKQDPFVEFQHVASSVFSFLVAELGFAGPDTAAGGREISLLFKRGEVAVVLRYELGGEPSVGVSILPKGDRGRHFGLPVIVAEHLGISDPHAVLPRWSSLQLEPYLAELAGLLKTHAIDILAGRQDRLPGLRRLQAQRARQHNQQRFGTATGETPRFPSRPSLPELFSDTLGNPGLVEPRAYQAVWDYGYSVAELADFLKRSNDDVTRLLSAWEDMTS